MDVHDLRSKICQDFLKMIVLHGWQMKLNDLCDKNIRNDKHADSYRPIQRKIREKGSEFTVYDLDVSNIATIILYTEGVIHSLSQATINAFIIIKDDRNDTRGHSSDNEEIEEL